MPLTIPEQTLVTIAEIIGEATGIDSSEVSAEDELVEDLELSTDLEFTQIVAKINKAFDIELHEDQFLEEYEGLDKVTVRDLAQRVTEELELG